MLDRPVDNPTAEPEPKGQAVYAFPSKSRCPVCSDVNTRAWDTHGNIQRRKCMVCGASYKVVGVKI